MLQILGAGIIGTFLVATWSFALLTLRMYRELIWINGAAVVLAVMLSAVLIPAHGARGAAVTTATLEVALALAYGVALSRRRPDLRPSLAGVPRVALALARGLRGRRAAAGLLADRPRPRWRSWSRCCWRWGPCPRSSCTPSGASPGANVTAVPATIPLDAPKSDSYYELGRSETLAHLPAPVWARARRRLRGRWRGAAACAPGGRAGSPGIEMLPEPAALAERVYDQVLVGDAIGELPRATGPFDTILCYDVLEHLYDPLALVRALLTAAAPGARLHVSVPNASHISLLRDLILRGTFGYEPAGHRDATHIRWFTRRDIVALIGEAGWQVQSVANSAAAPLPAPAPADPRALDRVPGRAVVRAGARARDEPTGAPVGGDTAPAVSVCVPVYKAHPEPNLATVAARMPARARRPARASWWSRSTGSPRGRPACRSRRAPWTSAKTAACRPAGTRPPAPREAPCSCSATTTCCSARAR